MKNFTVFLMLLVSTKAFASEALIGCTHNGENLVNSFVLSQDQVVANLDIVDLGEGEPNELFSGGSIVEQSGFDTTSWVSDLFLSKHNIKKATFSVIERTRNNPEFITFKVVRILNSKFTLVKRTTWFLQYNTNKVTLGPLECSILDLFKEQ